MDELMDDGKELRLHRYYSDEEMHRLHQKISAIIAINRIEVDMSSEEIANEILQAIFNKKK